ncbi:hypothetical protein [Butyricicoccus porcorum]|uniref:hypothetical protein n=1 Tax=Butyricicoccus porcorum TaxID=1945634 RepID=UPI0013FDA0D5|nr:hypothetical protein [Butyricicoccus porcorum]
MKKIIATVLATAIIPTSTLACTPRYKPAVPDVMAQVRVSASKAGTAVKNNEGNNPSLAAALAAAAAAAGAAAGSSVSSGNN